MFRQRFPFILLLFACIAQFAAAEDLQWLQYHSARQARDIVGDISSQTIELIDNKPEGVELPEFKSEEPVFGKWKSPMVNNGFLLIAIDKSKKNSPYNSLYIDSDGDGDLTDETPIAAYQTDNIRSDFGPVKIIYEYEDEPVTYHLNIQFYSPEKRRRIYAYSGGWYEGGITIDGEKKHCVLIDQNSNGSFNDKSNNFWKSDRIRIGKKTDRDTNFTGNFIEIEGELYRPEIAPDGACITITKAQDVTFGTIKMPESIKEFAAGGENGLLNVSLEKGTGKLPVGKYRIHHWAIDRKDEKAGKWSIKGEGFRKKKGLFDVTEDQEVNLAIGEPVICKLKVDEKNNQFAFKYELKGNLGEQISISRNNNRAAAPKLRITNEEAEYDRSFTFEYG
ncbi:MAG: hypothetical protein FVQ79_06110 [Planctomycetes bacterium]|nr:hypothetical protein [Planctomycetota bacterium]